MAHPSALPFKPNNRWNSPNVWTIHSALPPLGTICSIPSLQSHLVLVKFTPVWAEEDFSCWLPNTQLLNKVKDLGVGLFSIVLTQKNPPLIHSFKSGVQGRLEICPARVFGGCDYQHLWERAPFSTREQAKWNRQRRRGLITAGEQEREWIIKTPSKSLI